MEMNVFEAAFIYTVFGLGIIAGVVITMLWYTIRVGRCWEREMDYGRERVLAAEGRTYRDFRMSRGDLSDQNYFKFIMWRAYQFNDTDPVVRNTIERHPDWFTPNARVREFEDIVRMADAAGYRLYVREKRGDSDTVPVENN